MLQLLSIASLICLACADFIIPHIDAEAQVVTFNGEGIDWDERWWEMSYDPPLEFEPFKDDLFGPGGLFTGNDKPARVLDYNRTGPEF